MRFNLIWTISSVFLMLLHSIRATSVQTCPLLFARSPVLSIQQMHIDPSPVLLRHNHRLHTNLTINVHQPIGSRWLLATEVYKIQPNGIRIRLPCRNGAGSCLMTIQRARQRLSSGLSHFFESLNFQFRNGWIQPGTYSVENYEGTIYAAPNSPEQRLIRLLGAVSCLI